MSSTVLDASALLVLLNQEPDIEEVSEAVIAGAAISAVNVSEVVAKLRDRGMPESLIRAALEPLGLEMVEFDSQQAYEAGLLRSETRHAGLSLGDRACLALARRLGLPALTADRAWQRFAIGAVIRLLRSG